MREEVDVVVIGAGQAGLAVSHELTAQGVQHVVLERGRVAQTWRERWDSFCLVTPNWSVQLPGGAYAGEDVDGFMNRDELVAHLEAYAAASTTIREGVEVTSVAPPADGGGFELSSSGGELVARCVVVATGAYQKPHRPPCASSLPERLLAIDAEDYRNPTHLPPGAVLVVGSGQTGCQLADELCRAGRHVFLACGRAPWTPRRFDGRDMFAWLVEAGYLDAPLSTLPNPEARLLANVQASGHDGGRDLHFRTLQDLGVALQGHFRGVADDRALFDADLDASVAFGDARYADIRELLRKSCDRRGVPAPHLPEPPPFHADPPESVELRSVGTVIFTSGFRPDYARWVSVPGAFDAWGFPVQQDGASPVADGLYFVGSHFLRKRKSSLLYGVGEDAQVVASAIADKLRPRTARH